MAKPLKHHVSVQCNLLLPNKPDTVTHDFGAQCDIGSQPPSKMHVSVSFDEEESTDEYEEPLDQSFSMETDASDADEHNIELVCCFVLVVLTVSIV